MFLGDDNYLDIVDKGNVFFLLPSGIKREVKNVLYIPKLTKNLLSVSQLIEQTYKVEFEGVAPLP